MTNNNFLARLLLGHCLWIVTPLAFATVTVVNYDFPVKDKFVATVIGTPADLQPDLPSVQQIKFQKKRLTVFPDRQVPDLLWYAEELYYSVALQDKPSPLIFLIAGTGASHNGSKNVHMARAFHKAGFHVVSISSPTYPNFVTAASSTAVVGHAQIDAEDLYRVMELIWSELDESIDATSFNLTGYSLGAFNSAYVAKLDEERQSFNFRKVLLINPPVSLYNSISLLDRMTQNIPGGEDNFAQFFDKLVKAFSGVYKKQDEIGEDFLYKAYRAMDLKNEQLAALVGVSFRMSSTSLVFTSDVMTDYGYVKPKGLELDRYADLSVYDQIFLRLGFTDYYHNFFYPFYKSMDPSISRDEFIAAVSLTAISDYLATAEKISVMHNEDDIILEPGEINFFNEVFGERATIYPYGGHCGNMSYTENVRHMVSTFTSVAP
ncbi:MAG: alpha/beta hydrolase [Pseudomonadota bacterium]